jgi:DNA-binding NarL/FixJ family response regulator
VVTQWAPDARPAITNAIADDQHLVRAGFAAILSARGDIEVVGEAADGAEAVAVAAATSPDVVLMDLRMPGTDGVAATAQLVAMAGPPRVLVLTTYDTDDDVFRALRAGATGFLLKDVGSMLTKLGLRNRVQAVVTAYEHGLVSPGQVER